ncbi:MAG TPA: hypothetical protein VK578_15530 [Edaphobacter sp.]|nr:hypothetical protein [Edaphobacter sp.]
MIKSLAFAIWVLVIAGRMQMFGQSKTHGTVNVLLANKNGLVLVTDSRLSNERHEPVGYGQKLFVIDDHIVCSIADFYSDTGPTMGGSTSAFTTAPGILKALIEMHREAINGKHEQSIQLVFDDLINIYTFCLTALANLDSVENPNRKPSGAQLTLAGYEEKALRVMQVSLKPVPVQNVWEYIQLDRKDRIVTDGLVKRFAGITDRIDSILSNPTDKSVLNDPILSYLTSEIARNNGRDLTLNDLRQAAVQLKEQTSRRYPNVVGGKTQFVTMEDGHISSQELLTPDTEKLDSIKFAQIYNLEISGSSDHPMDTFQVPPPVNAIGYIFAGIRFAELTERMDGKAYIRSRFEDCVLQYTGSEAILFDAHNIVANTTLEIGKDVLDSDRFLVQFRKDFPSVKVLRVDHF